MRSDLSFNKSQFCYFFGLTHDSATVQLFLIYKNGQFHGPA